MKRLRTTWMALFGVILLLSLSISSAFGARGGVAVAGGEQSNVGQAVSEFVHSLVHGDDEEDEVADEDTDGDTDGDTEEDTEEDTDGVDEEGDLLGSNHGQCVAEFAHDKTAVDGENLNHGGAVSEAARTTCWVEEVVDETGEEDEVDETEDTSFDPDKLADRQAAKDAKRAEKQAAKDAKEQAKDVKRADRQAAKDTKKADKQAAKDAKRAAKAARH